MFVQIDAYEYLVLLHTADGELSFGTDPQHIRDAADRLRTVNPQHVLVRLLDAKAARASVIREIWSQASGRGAEQRRQR